MKLQEYFNQKKDQGLSDIQKMDVYYAIMDKNMKKSFQRKRSFLHVKSFVYTSFLLFFLVGFYGMYFFQQTNIEDSEWYLLSRLANTNVAQADFVAKIVDFDGSFYIEQAGKTIQTSNIKDGDIVTLREDAQIVFHIDDDTKAKIVGPAKFVINKKAQWYKVALLYGEYVELSSLQKENKHNIELAVDGLLVSQWEKKKPINFQVVKQWKGHVIKNNWAKLLVSSDDQKATSVGNKQVLAIQWNDISLFDSFEKFAKAVKDKNLSQTFTFVEEVKTEIVDTIVWQEEIKELEEEEILSIDEQEIPNIDLGLVNDEQKIATPEQTKVIEAQLNKSLLQENLDELVIAYKAADQAKFATSYTELERKISTIAKTFQYQYTIAKWTEQEKISTIISTIQDLSDYIAKKYLIPPKYIDSLKAIIPILSPLKSVSFETATE